MLDIENTLIVLIDIQERLVMMLNKQEPIIKAASRLANAASIMNIPTVLTEQYPQGLGKTIFDVTSVVSENTPIIEKTSFSAMSTPEFFEKIKPFLYLSRLKYREEEKDTSGGDRGQVDNSGETGKNC